MIIGVSGKSKAGKDELFKFAKLSGFEKVSFASPLKNMAKEAFGLDEYQVNGDGKDEVTKVLNGKTPRELLIKLGNLYREFDSEYWVKAAMKYVQQNSDRNFMVTDVRYLNEAEAIRNNGGIIVRLERHSNRDCLVSDSTKQSPSETALDGYPKFDFVLDAVDNVTPDDLAKFWNVLLAVISLKI